MRGLGLTKQANDLLWAAGVRNSRSTIISSSTFVYTYISPISDRVEFESKFISSSRNAATEKGRPFSPKKMILLLYYYYRGNRQHKKEIHAWVYISKIVPIQKEKEEIQEYSLKVHLAATELRRVKNDDDENRNKNKDDLSDEINLPNLWPDEMLFLVDEEVNQGRRLPPRLAYNLFFYGTLGSAPSVCLVSSPIDLISSLSYLVYLLPVDERRRRRLLVLLSIGSCSVDSFAWLLTSESVRVQFVSSFIPCTRSSLRLEPHHSSDRIYIQLMVCWWW